MAIELSLDGSDGSWMSVVSSAPNSGCFQWSLPAELPTSTNCHLRFTLDAVSAITPQPFTILGTFLAGDHDGDGDVDGDDFAEFPACMTGPNGSPLPPGCSVFDFDTDEDVDLTDFAQFQTVFTGAQP